MRRFVILAAAAFGVALALGATTASAQDILGVSFRATEAMPAGTDRGTADIRANDGGYIVSADFSDVTDSLVLDDFEGATAWVVWAVDMNGQESNIGQLNSDLVLEDASVDFMPSGLTMTAEASADVTSPSSEALFRVVLRQVEQSSEESAATAAATATPKSETASGGSPEKPSELPTTGQLLRDLLVLAAVAVVLLVGGLQLRRVRL